MIRMPKSVIPCILEIGQQTDYMRIYAGAFHPTRCTLLKGSHTSCVAYRSPAGTVMPSHVLRADQVAVDLWLFDM